MNISKTIETLTYMANKDQFCTTNEREQIRETIAILKEYQGWINALANSNSEIILLQKKGGGNYEI